MRDEKDLNPAPMDASDAPDPVTSADAEKTVERRVSPATVPPAEGGEKDGPARRLGPRGRVAALLATCAVALCACLAGVGYAAGWWDGAPEPAADAAAEQDAPAEAAEDEPADGADEAEGVADAGEADPADEAGASDAEPADGTSPDAAAPAEAGAASAASAPAGSSAPAETPASSAPAADPAPAPAPAPAPEPTTITVHVSIDSSRAASEGWPSSMGSSSVTLSRGATAYDALCAMGVSVSGSSSYVRGINGLSEFDCGSGSGWMYAVNGSYPSVGAGSKTLSDGDSVYWVYTCDLGNDL